MALNNAETDVLAHKLRNGNFNTNPGVRPTTTYGTMMTLMWMVIQEMSKSMPKLLPDEIMWVLIAIVTLGVTNPLFT